MKFLELLLFIIKWLFIIAGIIIIALLATYFIAMWYSDGVKEAIDIFKYLFGIK